MRDVIVERDIGVEMRDGIELATDVYRPPDEGGYPTLVHRIPYDKSFAWYVGSLMFNPLDAVDRDYAVVVQDTRGRFESDGEWEPFVNEADDGYDTVEWAADQPWSNGKVGIYGSSYMGVTTWQTVIADPPHLETAIAYLTGGDYHDGWTFSGGVFELGFNLHWILGLGWDTLDRRVETGDARDALATAHEYTSEAAEHLPVIDIPGTDRAAPYWREWLEHPSYDSYWEEIDVTAQANRIAVPVLHVAGWFDLFLRGHLDVYRAIAEEGSDRAREHQRLLIGPWDHAAYLSGTPSQVGERRFGPGLAGGVSFMNERSFEWFDYWLKEDQTDEPRSGVEYLDIGRKEWVEAEQWPPTHTKTEYYLHSGGGANSRFGDGRLRTEPPTDQPADSYVYDPTDPVQTCGGRAYMPELAPGGIQNRSEVEEREDVLVYTSPRLTEPVTIAGPVEVTLYASSSTPDTDFVATLVDVEPDGYCASIADGIQRGRYRNSDEEVSFMTPGDVYEISVDLWGIAHTFKPGHRIRVEVTSSNFPRFERNPNAAVPVAEATDNDMQPASIQIYHDADRLSYVSLPVIK